MFTTLNIYAHSSEQMKRDAARKIDESIGTALGADLSANPAPQASENGITCNSPTEKNALKTPKFEPYVGKRRRSGTGSVHQVSKNVWEGRYSPIINGKRIARNIYANSEEECEIKLAELIKEMKAELGIK